LLVSIQFPIQLAHAGRKAVLLLGMAIKTGCHRGGWETVAPSAIPFQDTDTIPVALDKSGIEK
jgi:2,4-dienoyl-CoA reductase-like NADH-dependent reductase (Old Yellow Enzyme family)